MPASRQIVPTPQSDGDGGASKEARHLRRSKTFAVVRSEAVPVPPWTVAAALAHIGVEPDRAQGIEKWLVEAGVVADAAAVAEEERRVAAQRRDKREDDVVRDEELRKKREREKRRAREEIAALRELDREALLTMEPSLRHGELPEWEEHLRRAAIAHMDTVYWDPDEEDPTQNAALKLSKTNYAKPLDVSGGWATLRRSGITLLQSHGKVGGERWALFKDPEAPPSSPPMVVSGVLLQVRFQVEALYSIDTVAQTFGARLVVEAKLDFSLHPQLAMQDGSPLTPHAWDPRLAFHNAVSLDEWTCRTTVWPDPVARGRFTSIVYKYDIAGTFSETMELSAFPFDAQVLQLNLYSRRGADQVTLCPQAPHKHTFKIRNMPEVNSFPPLRLHTSEAAAWQQFMRRQRRDFGQLWKNQRFEQQQEASWSASWAQHLATQRVHFAAWQQVYREQWVQFCAEWQHQGDAGPDKVQAWHAHVQNLEGSGTSGGARDTETDGVSRDLAGNGQYLMCIAATTKTIDSHRGRAYPVLNGFCIVQRKSGYYVVNVAVPLFLITSITFCVLEYGICDVDCMAARMDVALGLLLTAMAFKLTISEDLPNISYLTQLDVYLFVCLVVLCLVCFETVALHAIHRVYFAEPMEELNDDVNATDEDYLQLEATDALIRATDYWANLSLLFLFVAYSVWWLGWGLCGHKLPHKTHKDHAALVRRNGLDVPYELSPLVVASFNMAIETARPTEFCAPAEYAALDKVQQAYAALLGDERSPLAGVKFEVPDAAVDKALQTLGLSLQRTDARQLLRLFQGRTLRELHQDPRLFSLVKEFEKHAAANRAGNSRPVWATCYGYAPADNPVEFFGAIAGFLMEGGAHSLRHTQLRRVAEKQDGQDKSNAEWLTEQFAEAANKLGKSADGNIHVNESSVVLAMMLWDYVHDLVVRHSGVPLEELVADRRRLTQSARATAAKSYEAVVSFLCAGSSCPLTVLVEMSHQLLTNLKRTMGDSAMDWRFWPEDVPAEVESFTVVCVHASLLPSPDAQATDLSAEWIAFAAGGHERDAGQPAVAFTRLDGDQRLAMWENVALQIPLAGTAEGDAGTRHLTVFGVHLSTDGRQSATGLLSAHAFASARRPDCAYLFAGDANIKNASEFQRLFAGGGPLHGKAVRANPKHLPTCNKQRVFTHQIHKVLQQDTSCKMVLVCSATLRSIGFERLLGQHVVGEQAAFRTPSVEHGWMGDHAGVVAKMVAAKA